MSGPHRAFFGHHKCASRFFRLTVFRQIARDLGFDVVSYAIVNPPFHFSSLPDVDLLALDYERLKAAPAVVNFLNASPAVLEKLNAVAPDFVGLRVLRDPRSILVSGYFHHRAGHPIAGPAGFVWEKLGVDRPLLECLSEEEGLIHKMDNISGAVITDQILAWPGDVRVLEWRVEDIAERRGAFVAELTRHLRLKKAPAIDWTRNFSDSGAGHWRDHFTPRVKDALKARFGEALVRLGYESSLDW